MTDTAESVRWAVFHQLAAGGRRHSRLRLVVEDVPAGVPKRKVLAALEAAGCAGRFSEAGIPMANHVLLPEPKWPADIEAAGERPDVRTWEALQGPQPTRRLTVDCQPAEYARLQQAAAHAGLPLATWARVVVNDAARDELQGAVA